MVVARKPAVFLHTRRDPLHDLGADGEPEELAARTTATARYQGTVSGRRPTSPCHHEAASRPAGPASPTTTQRPDRQEKDGAIGPLVRNARPSTAQKAADSRDGRDPAPRGRRGPRPPRTSASRRWWPAFDSQPRWAQPQASRPQGSPRAVRACATPMPRRERTSPFRRAPKRGERRMECLRASSVLSPISQ